MKFEKKLSFVAGASKRNQFLFAARFVGAILIKKFSILHSCREYLYCLSRNKDHYMSHKFSLVRLQIAQGWYDDDRGNEGPHSMIGLSIQVQLISKRNAVNLHFSAAFELSFQCFLCPQDIQVAFRMLQEEKFPEDRFDSNLEFNIKFSSVTLL